MAAPIHVDMEVRRAPDALWEELDMAIDFHQPIDPDAYVRFEFLLSGWYEVGACHGYGGHLHNMEEPPYVDLETGTGSWWIDMGDTTEEALQVLLRAIKGFCNVYQIPRVTVEIKRYVEALH